MTLTSIPPRFVNLPRKLASIGRQTVRPDRVELHLPRAYHRFPGERPALPPLPDWVEVVETDIDLGPATKVLPAARRWRGTDLLLCDDDRRQDRHWLSRFVAGRAERPHDIICERGWNITERMGLARANPEEPRAVLAEDRGRTPAYRLQRILSLTLYHPPRKIYAQSGHAEVLEGFLGALVPADALPGIPDQRHILILIDAPFASSLSRCSRTPMQAMKHWHKSHPHLFVKSPRNLPGRDT